MGFRFYIPDPAWVEWKNKDRELRKQKIPGRLRPKKPERSGQYPTKITIAGELIKNFKYLVPNAKILAVNADAAYCCVEFTKNIEQNYLGTQIISQIRGNQLVKMGKQQAFCFEGKSSKQLLMLICDFGFSRIKESWR